MPRPYLTTLLCVLSLACAAVCVSAVACGGLAPVVAHHKDTPPDQHPGVARLREAQAIQERAQAVHRANMSRLAYLHDALDGLQQ